MIPVMTVTQTGLAKTWEHSVGALLHGGTKIKTQYDDPADPPSLDCMMTMNVMDPLSEPMITAFFPGGPDELQEYVMEVCDGIKDGWVRDRSDASDHRWSYTYHGRLTNYFGQNQIAQIVDRLVEAPYTRRAQAITWVPQHDGVDKDPPCLQRLWCRATENEDGSLGLVAHSCWRSRDALKAAFMNMFAITLLINEQVVKPLALATGRRVVFEQYVDSSDSYHVYGSYIRKGDVDCFNKVVERGIYMPYDVGHDGDWKSIMEEARPRIIDAVHAKTLEMKEARA